MSAHPPPPELSPPESLDILLPDLNGIPRGQRAFGPAAADMLQNGLPWPSSLFAMRFDGQIVEETGMGLRSGDPDYPCRAVAGTFAPAPWRPGGTQAVFEMRDEAGGGFFADPREALRRVLRRLGDDGVHPVVAFEMEFSVRAGNNGDGDHGADGNGDLHSMDELSRRSRMLDMIQDAAKRQDIPLFAAMSEDAPGQFEAKLLHGPDPLAACLHAILLRRAVRECARACGLAATFMAKPAPGQTGNGMHIHVSATSAPGGGRPLFADDARLQSAVAGALATAREGTAFYAPFANSYRRFVPGYYAPVNLSWGRENRSVMVRLPRTEQDAGKRLEFRLPGADANPHLALAALLAGAHDGMSRRLRPPPEAQGDATAAPPGIPLDWRPALDELRAGKTLPSYLGEDFVRHYLTVKESEWRDCQAHVSDYDRERYQAAF